MKGRGGGRTAQMRSVGLFVRFLLGAIRKLLFFVRVRKICHSLEKCGTDFVIDVDLLQ